MRSGFILSCESTIDLPYFYCEQREIPVLFYSYQVDGVSYEDDMGRDPEALPQFYGFLDAGKLKDVLGMFDRKNELLGLLESADDDVNICIGRENGVEALEGSSLVFKKIIVNGRAVGAVGVLGPCRMDYSKVVSAIRYLSLIHI